MLSLILNMKKGIYKKIFPALIILTGAFLSSNFTPPVRADVFSNTKFISLPATKIDSGPKPQYGIKAGLNISDLVGHDDNNLFIDYDLRITGTGGFFLDIPLFWGISFQPELLYYQKGVKKTEDYKTAGNIYVYQTTTLKLDYYEMPVLLHFNIAPSLEDLIPTLYFGPSIGKVARAKIDDYYEEVDEDGNTQQKSRTLTGIAGDLKEYDTSVVAGLGFKSPDSDFSSDIRYTLSVESPFKTDTQTLFPGEEVDNYKNGMLTVLIGYSF